MSLGEDDTERGLATAGFLPGLGEAADVTATVKDLVEQQWGNAAINAIGVFLPVVSGKLIKGVFKGADEAAEGADTAAAGIRRGDDSAETGARQSDDSETARRITTPGPGEWRPVNEHMSQRAADYQARFGPLDQAYFVDDIKFDGYDTFGDGKLYEAKGRGYEGFLNPDGTFKEWFDGRQDIVNQLRNQHRVSGDTPVEWHVAERRVADAIREIARDLSVNIRIVHNP